MIDRKEPPMNASPPSGQRQQLLVVHLASPHLESGIVAWSTYDGASGAVLL